MAAALLNASVREPGIDIAQNATQSVFGPFKAGRLYSFVITVSGEETADRRKDRGVLPG